MLGLEKLGLLGLFIGTFLAATVFPFSSDALYIGALVAGIKPAAVLIVGTLGNWFGGVTTYFLGRLAKWEWVEKHFNVKPQTLEKHHLFIEKHGVWVALLTWVPFVGDVIAIALGFYKSRPVWTMLFLLVGKAGRFIIWAKLLGAI